MGSMGSGGHNSKGHGVTSNGLSLDVNLMLRRGVLKPGWAGEWSWKRGDEPAGNILVVTGENKLALSYRSKTGDGPWQDIKQTVGISWSPCRYGGQRPFLICPGCGRTVLKLYIKGQAQCRKCHGLTYASQREDAIDRTRRRADKIRERLGGQAGAAWTFPERPKGMHKATYDRLKNRVFDADMQIDEMIETVMARFAGRMLRMSGHMEKGFW